MTRGLRLGLGIWVLIFVIAGMVLRARCDERSGGADTDSDTDTDTDMLTEYIDWFHCKVHPKHAAKAKKMIPTLIHYSERYQVDPLLVACLISLESSWRPRPGALNEAGYMQVMRNKWSRHFDLDTPDGQIHAGVARLALAFERCGTVERALTHYSSGRCVSKSERTKKKMRYRKRYYMKMVERFKR